MSVEVVFETHSLSVDNERGIATGWLPGRLSLDGRRLAAELGIQDHVTLPGWQSDVRGYFEAMDVFALSSRREGLPNVLLEAMALEVPVVATRIAGIPRLIRDEENGLLVEAGMRPRSAGHSRG